MLIRSTLLGLLSIGLLTSCDGKQKQQAKVDGGADASTDAAMVAPRTIELVTDKLGITHVYAPDDEAALYGEGYAMARDRLFQMELVRRQALGTAAELLGEAAFEDDVASRTINFAALGKLDLERVRKDHAEMLALAQAWVKGVNARIAEVANGTAARPYGLGPSELDFVPEPWTEAHVFAVGKMLSFGMSSSLEYELLASAVRRLAPDFAQRVPLSLPALDAFTMVDAASETKARAPRDDAPHLPATLPKALEYKLKFWFGRPQSNNWAIAGSLSDNGRPYVCGDPHQPLGSPSRFWPVHIHSKTGGGKLDVIGFAFVGTPGVQLGHNDRVAWTATTNFADVMDLFELKLGDASEVSVGGTMRAVKKRDEVFRIRAADGSFSEETLTLREVENEGVILPQEMLPIPINFVVENSGSDAILLKWTGLRGTPELAAYGTIDRATNIDEFEQAANLLEVGAVNFVAADREHILYHVHADVPDRGSPAARPMPWHLVAADQAAALWGNGFLSADKLPHQKDPARGFLSTANNDPWGFTRDGDTANDPYYYGNFYDRGFRAFRIRARLEELAQQGGKISRADLEDLQRDVHTGMADSLLPALQQAVQASATEPALAVYKNDAELSAMAQKLAAWDRRFTRDSGEAVVFLAFEWLAVRAAFAQALGSPLFEPIAREDPVYLLGVLRNTIERRYPQAESFMQGGRDAFVLRSLKSALDWVKQRFGSLDTSSFRLSMVHAASFQSRYGGKLDAGTTAVNGSADTINVSGAPFFEKGVPASMFLSDEGSLYRMVVGFADDGTPEATLNFARGTSGEPDSPHFADRQSDWADVRYTKLPFRRVDVDAAQESRDTIIWK